MVIFNKAYRFSRSQYLLISLLVFIEIVITILICNTVRKREEQAHLHLFESQAQEITAGIQKQISVNLEKLISLDALYDVAYPVSEQEFSKFTRHLISTGSSIKALSWIPRISAVQKVDFERRSQKPDNSSFVIFEKSSDKKLPAGQRAEYYPVCYIEPINGNEAALGFDLASCRIRRQALEKAAIINQLVVTEPVRLVQSKANEKGVLIFFPFKKDDQIIGYFTGVFSINELVTRSTGDLRSKYFQIRIFDTLAGKGNQLLADNATGVHRKKDENLSSGQSLQYGYSQLLDVADRKWLIEITPSQYYLDFRSGSYWLILLLCIAIGIGLCYHIIQHFQSENLLLNILPASIAEELKQKGSADAQGLENVSILFTDFKGFTEHSSRLSAQMLVEEINTCYAAFDRIITKYGIEKIKTIGDAYMAAGGLPVPSRHSTKNTVLAALEMQMFIKQRKEENDALGKPFFEMRAGIHTGHVVAGIVGIKKFQYDIWGDTVNIAKRMESAGKIGHVNVSQSTYEIIRSYPDFEFEHRGNTILIGKNKFEMWITSLSLNEKPIESHLKESAYVDYSFN